MSSKPGNTGLIARRVISFTSARLRLLFVPVLIAWALLGVRCHRTRRCSASAGAIAGRRQWWWRTAYRGDALQIAHLDAPQPFASAVVGSPDLVDALPMSDRRLYIQGKKVGTTNVSVFDQSMQLVGVIDVEVTLDTGNLQEKIRASTGSSAIRVGSSNGQIVLSGLAGNSVAADRAVEVAKTMVPEGGNIVNAMKVAPSQQVMLRVRFLEVARSASREIGVNWFGANNAGNRGFSDRPGHGRPRGADLLSAPLQLGCGPPCVDASGNPVPATRFARWQWGTGPSDIQYCGDFALWCGSPLASRWPVSPPRGAASTLL